jgi:NitT/TauT family transport system ATP-binding protein
MIGSAISAKAMPASQLYDIGTSPKGGGGIPLIKIDGISHEFISRGKSVAVFKNISFDVRASEFVAILGPSGCGKSTLLQIIAGLLPPVSGQVVFEGQAVSSPPRDMIYLFQQYSKSLFAWRTNSENVAFALEGKGIARKEKRERAFFYLRSVGLESFENHYPWQLSGGMQQRVAIARALAAQPQVLLLDEPFSAVDALTRLELQALVLKICDESKLTVVLVTHDVDEAVFMASRILMLQNRPATIVRNVQTDLARPRDAVTTRELPRFLDLRRDLLDALLKRDRVN